MINSLINLFNQGLIAEEYKDNVIKNVLKYYTEVDFNNTPLLVNRNVHRLIRKLINDPDPYKKLKDRYNSLAIEYYEKYKEKVKNSSNPFQTALRLAIAGNIIDFGPGHKIDIDCTIDRVLNNKFPIDDSLLLEQEVKKAKKILYIADNTGEIVFDKLFIETINHPEVVLVVRNSPILNDATMDDAKALGLDKIAKVITNGDDAPGTLLSAVSEEFFEEFNSADLIISKGQGNYEGLNHIKDKNLFLLLMAKCEIIADYIGVKKGDCIIKKAGN